MSREITRRVEGDQLKVVQNFDWSTSANVSRIANCDELLLNIRIYVQLCLVNVIWWFVWYGGGGGEYASRVYDDLLRCLSSVPRELKMMVCILQNSQETE